MMNSLSCGSALAAVQLARAVADQLRERVKALGCERHKLVVQVCMGNAGALTNHEIPSWIWVIVL
jgi:hypothetical protein